MSENEELKRTSTTCVFCLRSDYGYSNYTVEGTTLSCLKGLNDELDGAEDQWFDVTPKLAALLDVALTCASYRQGVGPWLDVDREGLPYDKPVTLDMMAQYTDDPEVAGLLLEELTPDVA